MHAAEGTCGEARDGAGVAVQRVRESEGVADDGFAADGEEDGSVEAEETGAVVEDGEIVRRLLGEVDAWVENDLVWEKPGGGGGGDAVGEEGVEFGHDVGPCDVRVFFFGEPDGVHDEEGGAVGGAEPGVAVVREGAHVIEEVAAVGEDGGDGFGAPCIEGEERGPDLAGDGWGFRGGGEGPVVEGVDEGEEAGGFLGDGDWGAVGAGGFCAGVDDVSAVAGHGDGLGEGCGWVEGAVAAEGIVIDIDDAHDERAARERDGAAAGEESHEGGYLRRSSTLVPLRN